MLNLREDSVELISRRNILSVAAAGGLLTTAEASAQPAVPQPERPGHGGTEPGPRNLERDRQKPDMLVPPSTDHGTLPNLRFSFSHAHMRLETGGWTRQVTARELGVSKDIAGVNMRLNAGGVRELHWHKAAEGAYMLSGTARSVVFSSGYSTFDPGSRSGRMRISSRIRRWRLRRRRHVSHHGLVQAYAQRGAGQEFWSLGLVLR